MTKTKIQSILRDCRQAEIEDLLNLEDDINIIELQEDLKIKSVLQGKRIA